VGVKYEGIHFEWDDDKAEANVASHDGVTLHEAVTVFTDPLSIICEDDEHSDEERRFLTIGRSTRIES